MSEGVENVLEVIKAIFNDVAVGVVDFKGNRKGFDGSVNPENAEIDNGEDQDGPNAKKFLGPVLLFLFVRVENEIVIDFGIIIDDVSVCCDLSFWNHAPSYQVAGDDLKSVTAMLIVFSL